MDIVSINVLWVHLKKNKKQLKSKPMFVCYVKMDAENVSMKINVNYVKKIKVLDSSIPNVNQSVKQGKIKIRITHIFFIIFFSQELFCPEIDANYVRKLVWRVQIQQVV